MGKEETGVRVGEKKECEREGWRQYRDEGESESDEEVESEEKGSEEKGRQEKGRMRIKGERI